MRNFDFKRYTPRPKKLLRASLKNEAQSYLHGFSVLFVSSARHVLGILIPVLALCSVCFGVIALVFAPHQKRMFWGHTLKERGIVIFAWFLSCVFGLFHKNVCFGVIGLVFAPCQKRMFWGHTLRERDVVIFAWFLGSVFGLFHKSVCSGVIGLIFAPRQKRMFWGHMLKEQGIVIFAWFLCFV